MAVPGVKGGYPEIPLTAEEKDRETAMKKLGAALQAHFDTTGNKAALKGGTGCDSEQGFRGRPPIWISKETTKSESNLR